MMSNTTSLTDFFRMGVASPPPEERVMTPSKDRKKKDDKYKISNKCKFLVIQGIYRTGMFTKLNTS